MSSWDQYVDLLLSKSPAIKKGAIIGLDGSVWARSSNFAASGDELVKFAKLFENISSVPGTGADLEGRHYIVPRVEENLIFGKKEQTGFFAAKSKSAITIATYEGDNATSASVRSGVEYISGYLASSGY